MPYTSLSPGTVPAGGIVSSRTATTGFFTSHRVNANSSSPAPAGWIATDVTVDQWTLHVNTHDSLGSQSAGSLRADFRTAGATDVSLTLTAPGSFAVGSLGLALTGATSANAQTGAFDVQWVAVGYQPGGCPTSLLHYTAAASNTVLVGVGGASGKGTVSPSLAGLFTTNALDASSAGFFALSTDAIYGGAPSVLDDEADAQIPVPVPGGWTNCRVVTFPMTTGQCPATQWALRIDGADVLTLNVPAATGFGVYSVGGVASCGVGGLVSLGVRATSPGTSWLGAFLCTFTSSG